jgi:elongation factor P
MLSATKIRVGMVIKFNNELYSIFAMTHRTPGNLRGFVQVRMRSLRNGSMNEHRFSTDDKVEKAVLDEQPMEYLYDDGEYYYFMNTENYEQIHLTKELLGDATNYLIPQLKVAVEFYEGKPISVELPATVDMTVVETEPGIKSATVSNLQRWRPGWWFRCRRSSLKARRFASILPKGLIRKGPEGGSFPLPAGQFSGRSERGHAPRGR